MDGLRVRKLKANFHFCMNYHFKTNVYLYILQHLMVKVCVKSHPSPDIHKTSQAFLSTGVDSPVPSEESLSLNPPGCNDETSDSSPT